jgi:hypothetical protein
MILFKRMKIIISKYFSLSAAILLIILTAGCSSFKSSYVKADKKIFNINAEGKNKIRLSEPNGDLRITGIAGVSAITVNAQIFVKDNDEIKNAGEDVVIKLDSSGSVVSIKTEYDKGLFDIGGSAYVNYEVIIPDNIQVDVNSVNGDIYLTSVRNESSVETVNSTVNIIDCSGKLKIDGVNSDIVSNLNATEGLNISVVNGDVKLGGMKNIAAVVKISTVNGDLSFKGLTFSNIELNGKRSFKGTIGEGSNKILVSTVNGDIRLDANFVNINK